MSATENKKPEDTTASADFKLASMGEMMSRMMNMCRTGEGRFPDCVSMKNDMMKAMKNQPPRPRQEPTAKSEGEKK